MTSSCDEDDGAATNVCANSVPCVSLSLWCVRKKNQIIHLFSTPPFLSFTSSFQITHHRQFRYNKSTLKKLAATVKLEEGRAAEAEAKAAKSTASVPALEATVNKALAKKTKDEETMEKLLEAAKAEVIEDRQTDRVMCSLNKRNTF
jgi:hypothetical protein